VVVVASLVVMLKEGVLAVVFCYGDEDAYVLLVSSVFSMSASSSLAAHGPCRNAALRLSAPRSL
jgi:hypothetical protein